MSTNPQEPLSMLRQEIEAGGGDALAIDAGIAAALKAGAGTGDFLQLLSDAATRDEGMFSLIHAAESANDEEYVRGLCKSFPMLGAVDKVDSQGLRTLIQRCLLGDSDGSRADDGQGMEVFCSIRRRDGRQERTAAFRSPVGAGRRFLDCADRRAMARFA